MIGVRKVSVVCFMTGESEVVKRSSFGGLEDRLSEGVVMVTTDAGTGGRYKATSAIVDAEVNLKQIRYPWVVDTVRYENAQTDGYFNGTNVKIFYWVADCVQPAAVTRPVHLNPFNKCPLNCPADTQILSRAAGLVSMILPFSGLQL